MYVDRELPARSEECLLQGAVVALVFLQTRSIRFGSPAGKDGSGCPLEAQRAWPFKGLCHIRLFPPAFLPLSTLERRLCLPQSISNLPSKADGIWGPLRRSSKTAPPCQHPIWALLGVPCTLPTCVGALLLQRPRAMPKSTAVLPRPSPCRSGIWGLNQQR